ncbi:hypothetical protein [Halodesulfovibrio aestuarii]|uniref:hypothetical protein n=1 Tax=Halodesulfovibrio aestuarii TaxID=126333 RepID=UPI000411BABB
MTTHKLPLKMSIAHIFTDQAPRTKHHVFVELKSSYGTEKQFTRDTIENHLMSLKAVGILKAEEARLTARNELVQAYVITSFGLSKLVSKLN